MRKLKSKFTALFLSLVMILTLFSSTTGMQKVEAAGTASDLLSVAASQVGYHEKASNAYLDDFTANSGSANYTKYARDIGVANGYSWCATFVWWCMKSAGVLSSAYPSRTTVTRDWFNERGLYRARGTYTPKAGDYIIFGNVAHCGLVESVSGNIVYTIEGNSGDSVKRHQYYLTSDYILGYGIINYNGSSSGTISSTSDNPGSPYPIPTGNLRSGSSGDSVKWVQKFANDVMGRGISIDGIYGSQTISAVRTFQQQNGLTVDGIAGTQTIAAMLSIWRNKIAAAQPKPLDLGNQFCGIILRTDIWKPFKNTGSNIVLWDEKATGDYYWLFKKQSDGSYIIQSLYDGKVLDVYGSGTANGTNIQPCSGRQTDNANQRWFIYASGNSYRFSPAYNTNLSMDVEAAGTGNGTNIQIYEKNESIAQRFSIYQVPYYALKSISIASGYQKSMYVGDTQTLKYELSPSNTRTNMVTWSSSNTSVATVDSNGLVTAKGTGVATIKCISTYDKSISASIQISVVKKQVKTETTTESISEIRTETTTENPTETTTEVAPETSIETTTEMTTEIDTDAETEEEITEETMPAEPATENIEENTKNVTSTSIKSIKNIKKNKIKIGWKRRNNVTGYQIQLATNKKFTKNKKSYTITENDITSKTISKLERGKVYYVRIRTYILSSDNEKCYSSWSKTKKVKIKK